MKYVGQSSGSGNNQHTHTHTLDNGSTAIATENFARQEEKEQLARKQLNVRSWAIHPFSLVGEFMKSLLSTALKVSFTHLIWMNLPYFVIHQIQRKNKYRLDLTKHLCLHWLDLEGA